MDGNTVSVERVIKAPPNRIFALLADAGKHASFDGSESVDRATQKLVPLTMGSKFGMAMRGRKETLFIPYRTTNTVIEYEPDQRIAWQTTAIGGLVGGRIWRYELEPADGGTRVTESFDYSGGRAPGFVLGAMGFMRRNKAGMSKTLENIERHLQAQA